MELENSHMRPIFIAGPDRSGTTLMFALLASHPNISVVRRTNIWRYFYGRYGDLSDPKNFERCLSDMLRYKRMRHLSPNADRIRHDFWQGKPSYGRLFALFFEHNAEHAGKQRWGDKSLHTEHFVDNVVAEYPQAKILHMARDPRDRYASVRKRNGRDTPRIGAATGRWLFSLQRAQQNLERYPDNYMIVNYESLAKEPEKTLKRICAFIGEEYSPAMLSMEGVPEYRAKGGNSSFGSFEPGTISTRSIGRFREILSALEINFIQAFAGKTMQQVGYPLEPVKLSLGERIKFYALFLPINLLRMYGYITLTKLRMKRGIKVPTFRLSDERLMADNDPA